MIYFDNAATGGQKPDSVLSAVSSAVKLCANPGRSGHKLSLSCANLVQSCRRELCSFFDGYSPERVIFTKNCTEALNIALFGALKAGDHVITTPMEHNSVLRPLQYLQKSGVISYDICTLSQGNVCASDIQKLLRPNTKLVAMTGASNVTGALPPIAEIRRVLPDSVLLLVDGAQSAGHVPLSMRDLGVDMLALAGHKGMLGIQGSGALLFSDRVELSPLLHGGTGSMSVSLEMPDFYPDALEAGTLAFPAILSLLEGVRHLSLYFEQVRKKNYALTEYLLNGLKNLPIYQPYSNPNACGIVAFAHKNMQSEYLASVLSSTYDIAVRGGLHCAPLMHDALGTQSGLVRVSFSHFNSTGEIDELLSALKELENTQEEY